MVGDTSFVGCWRIVLHIRPVVICSVVLMSCVVTVFGCVVSFRCYVVGVLRCFVPLLCCWVVTVFRSVVGLLRFSFACYFIRLVCVADGCLRHLRETFVYALVAIVVFAIVE